MIKDLLGKTRNRDEEIYIYKENGEKNKADDVWKNYMEAWRIEIYQKTPIIDLTFWYGGENCKGKKFEMAEEEKEINNKIMKEPKMTEEELVGIINKQRNGKAAGVDGIKAEMMKYMIKNKRIREHLLKCFNKCIDEKVQEDWLRSKTTMIAKNRKPMILEFRPIAVTPWSSKVIYTFYRENIEELSMKTSMGLPKGAG